jgi:hypothetical protein
MMRRRLQSPIPIATADILRCNALPRRPPHYLRPGFVHDPADRRFGAHSSLGCERCGIAYVPWAFHYISGGPKLRPGDPDPDTSHNDAPPWDLPCGGTLRCFCFGVS